MRCNTYRHVFFTKSDGNRRRRLYDVADGCGVYKYVRSRAKLEFDISATTTSEAARIIGHLVAENTTLHGVKHLRRAKGTTPLKTLTKFID